MSIHNEKSGLVPSSEWKKKTYKVQWYEGETISVSVGQGYMLTTPLQLLNAYAAIANGGTLWKPLLVEDITTPDGKLISKPVSEKRGELGISEKTMFHVRDGPQGSNARRRRNGALSQQDDRPQDRRKDRNRPGIQAHKEDEERGINSLQVPRPRVVRGICSL